MKNNLIVLAIFGIGCLAGAGFQPEADMHNWSLCILYALMLQVGIGIGSNRSLQQELKKLSPKMLLVPAATITGTLAFSAAASLLLSQWSVFDCMAVGSGFAYYSLSSILITQFKEPSIGLQLATELGTIALLSNIIREMMSLVGAPLIRKYFGRLAPISAAGVNSMDVLLPSITRCSGKEVMPIAIFHGILTHANTSWDFARFEVCVHKWLDLGEDDYGVSFINDCKYGCSVRDSVVGLSMLKSGTFPNPQADQEYHEFTYSIYPHKGSWKEAGSEIGRAHV